MGKGRVRVSEGVDGSFCGFLLTGNRERVVEKGVVCFREIVPASKGPFAWLPRPNELPLKFVTFTLITKKALPLANITSAQVRTC